MDCSLLKVIFERKHSALQAAQVAVGLAAPRARVAPRRATIVPARGGNGRTAPPTSATSVPPPAAAAAAAAEDAGLGARREGCSGPIPKKVGFCSKALRRDLHWMFKKLRTRFSAGCCLLIVTC